MEKVKDYRTKIVIIGLITLAGIGYLIYSNWSEKETPTLPRYADIPSSALEADSRMPMNEVEKEQTIMIQIDIKGAVEKPGVYTMETGKRVHDAITMAGGTTEQADTSFVNLAAYINDGQMIYIPQIGEEPSQWPSQLDAQGVNNGSGKININTASKMELEQLPGIGPSKADAIIAYRSENGAFSDVQELSKVTGIGEKTLEKLLPYISVN